MNGNTLMQTTDQLSAASKYWPWLGIVLTTLVALFMVFDGVTKVLKVKPVMEACQKMNISPEMAVGLGLLLLACTTLYITPKTAVFGAVLLTGYLGGAVAAQLINRAGAFAMVFPVGFGVLTWAGLILREPRLLSWIFLRQ